MDVRPALSFSFLVLVLATAAGKAAAAPPDPSGGTGGAPLAGTLTVRVVAAGTTSPLAGAFVMAGPAEGVPFAGNVGTTDGLGEITFTSPALTGTITVTAGAAARAYVTTYALAVSEVVLPLPPIEPLQTARLGDQFSGIEVNNGTFCFGDGNLDFGFVVPAVSIDQALSGGVALGLSTTDEPLSTPQGPVLVPSNLYFPRQCELTQYYEKSSYHLRVSTGLRTLFGLSVRIPALSFVNARTIVDLIKAMTFREMDILRDLSVTADSDAADLNADLPLSQNLTLQVSNGQPGTQVLAAAGGRITAGDGQQEVIVTGLGAFDPDTDGSSATLNLTTRPATGELADLIHAAFVTQQRDTDTIGNGRGATTALIRSGFTPPATRSFSSFYGIVEVASSDDVTFSWTDVSSATSPPARHLNTSRLVHEKEVPNPDDPLATITESRTYWVLYTPGSAGSLTLPALPGSAPTAIPDPDATAANDRLDLTHAVQFLGDDPASFTYDGFAFSDVGSYGTHVSSNDRPLRCDTKSEITGLVLAKGTTPGQIVLSWNGSPDYCHDTLSDHGYEVYAAGGARPTLPPGSWPSDPPFDKITGQDLDGSLKNAGFTYVPPDGKVFYLITDRGLSENEGPVGHYGAFVPSAPAP